jgi:predicted amidohydrolase YtcJ
VTCVFLNYNQATERGDTMRNAASFGVALIAAVLFGAAPSMAQSADTVLVNGKILTVDDQFSIREALAVHDGRILATGSNSDVRRLAGPNTRVIDLQRRTVIPGLIDSHMHAIRAGLSFSTEVSWVGAPSLVEALDRIRQAAKTVKPGSWIIVAGGWNVQQLREKRRPAQAELVAAAPNNPVYVQLAYGWVIMTPAGFKALNITRDADLPAGGRLDVDERGQPTGGISGGQQVIAALFDRLPRPRFEQQVYCTKKFFVELNRLGLTGAGDPGGNNLSPADYQAVLRVWQQGQMTVRITYSLNGQTAGSELEELQSLTRMLPMGFGDDMLRFNGLGERVTWAMNNNNNPNPTDTENYYQIAKWAAERGMALTMHWSNDSSVGRLLNIFERLNKEVPITGLRWSVAHLNDASAESLQRMKALGMGWTVQDALYFEGEQFLAQRGVEAARRMPPLVTANKIGVVVGAGTDAHRVASYNPFTALQWLLDGKTAGGVTVRGPEETPSRQDAVRMYTIGSAWFSRDEKKRGSLEAGKLADLAVLNKDYMTVPLEQIGSIESLLTMVGGKIVYAAGPYQ